MFWLLALIFNWYYNLLKANFHSNWYINYYKNLIYFFWNSISKSIDFRVNENIQNHKGKWVIYLIYIITYIHDNIQDKYLNLQNNYIATSE